MGMFSNLASKILGQATPTPAAPTGVLAAAFPSSSPSQPEQRAVDRALVRIGFNEENELGLIMDRSVEMERIPALMCTMLGQMEREFPAQNLTVIAYAPSAPPRKIGTARLNAQTRDMTYIAERSPNEQP